MSTSRNSSPRSSSNTREKVQLRSRPKHVHVRVALSCLSVVGHVPITSLTRRNAPREAPSHSVHSKSPRRAEIKIDLIDLRFTSERNKTKSPPGSLLTGLAGEGLFPPHPTVPTRRTESKFVHATAGAGHRGFERARPISAFASTVKRQDSPTERIASKC